MPLTWDDRNLVRHTAKHYVGNPDEAWRDLGGAPVDVWDSWRARAASARCRYAEHPSGCPDAAACDPAHREAAPAYRALVDQDWAFAERHALVVYYRDAEGDPTVSGTGPRGVFVAVAERSSGERVAKTGFRCIEAPRGGPDPVLGAVRTLRAHASPGAGGRTAMELIQLETRLLRPLPAGKAPLDLLAHALRNAP